MYRRRNGENFEKIFSRGKSATCLTILRIFVLHAWNICQPVFSCKRIIEKGYAIFPSRQAQLSRTHSQAFIFLSTTCSRELYYETRENTQLPLYQTFVSPSPVHAIFSPFAEIPFYEEFALVSALLLLQLDERMAYSGPFSTTRYLRCANYPTGKLLEIQPVACFLKQAS